MTESLKRGQRRPLSVLLVDSQPFFRAGIREAMHRVGWLRVIGETSDGRQAVGLADRFRPEFILLDASRARATLAEIVRLRQRQPRACIVALTNYKAPDTEHQLLVSGADSCFQREGWPEELFVLLQSLYTRKLLAGRLDTPRKPRRKDTSANSKFPSRSDGLGSE